MRILIIDDDEALSRGIALYLHAKNKDYEVSTAKDGETGLAMLAEAPTDLIVLDVRLPDISGYQLCREIKKSGDIPILFLSSLGDTEDRITGLQMGGDDYMAKPFRLEELLLRINARLREKSVAHKEAEVDFSFGQLKLRKRKLVGGREEVALTETEYSILLLLAQNAGMSVSLEKIHRVVWDDAYDKDLRTVQSHMGNLRKKILQAYGTNELIATKWGDGYIFQR